MSRDAGLVGRRARVMSPPAVLFVVALALRLGFVTLYPQAPFGRADDRMYDQIGWSLATGNGFAAPNELVDPIGRVTVGPPLPTATTGPGYPAVLAAVYLVFGHSLQAVRVVQAVLSAAVVLLLYPLVRRAFGSAAANNAGTLVTLYPAFVIYCGMILSETLFLFSLVALVGALARAIRSDSVWRWLVAGAVMGAAILIREEAFVVAVMFGVGAFWRFRTARHLWKPVAFLLVTLVVVGGWTYRNYAVFREFTLVSANGGRTLWISTKGWPEWRPTDPELRSLIGDAGPMAQNKILGREGLRNILDDPLHYVRLCVERVPQFWVGSHTTYLMGYADSFDAYYRSGRFGPLLTKGLMLAGNLAAILAGALGAVRVLRDSSPVARTAAWLLLVPVLALAGVHCVLYATSRYQVPIMPFVLTFAAIPLVQSRAAADLSVSPSA